MSFGAAIDEAALSRWRDSVMRLYCLLLRFIAFFCALLSFVALYCLLLRFIVFCCDRRGRAVEMARSATQRCRPADPFVDRAGQGVRAVERSRGFDSLPGGPAPPAKMRGHRARLCETVRDCARLCVSLAWSALRPGRSRPGRSRPGRPDPRRPEDARDARLRETVRECARLREIVRECASVRGTLSRARPAPALLTAPRRPLRRRRRGRFTGAAGPPAGSMRRGEGGGVRVTRRRRRRCSRRRVNPHPAGWGG